MDATYLECVTAATVASASSMIVACPSELVKVKLQSHIGKKMYQGPLGVIAKVTAKNGFLGLYRGLVPMMLRFVHKLNFPFNFSQFL